MLTHKLLNSFSMKVYLGTDHAGFELKEKIKSWLVENEYNVEDC